MKQTRKKYDAKFKSKVAIEAIKERETLNERAAKYELSPVMISRWKKEFLENSAAAFETPKMDDAAFEKQKDRYLRKIGIQKQCRILGLSRTAHYYKPKGEGEENLQIMKKIDTEHIEHPAKGVVGMTDFLLENNCKVGLRRVRRLMRVMGIQAVYRKRSLSTLGAAKYIKPYLLRGLKVDHRNQVWSLHNSLDTSNCIEVLETAISRYGAPEIWNSDQGCQFTSKERADACAEYPDLKASMDGCGRAKDNIWIERFWKTIKYEYIYIQPEENGTDLFFGINRTVPSKLYIRQAAWS